MDETKDESFELLSSMSPKVDKTKKKLGKKKAPSRLALKSTIRRSSFYDKLHPTLNNKNIQLVDGSTDNSSDTGSSESRTNHKETVPVNNLLSQSKLTNIQKWIEDVNPAIEQDNHNISIFSTISSIQGDFTSDKNVGAVNSTFVNGIFQRKFDEFLTKVSSQFVDLRVKSKKNLSADKRMNNRKEGFVEPLWKKKVGNTGDGLTENNMYKAPQWKREIRDIDDSLDENIDDIFKKDSKTDRIFKGILDVNPLNALKEKYEYKKVDNCFKDNEATGYVGKVYKNATDDPLDGLRKKYMDPAGTHNYEEQIIDDSFEGKGRYDSSQMQTKNCDKNNKNPIEINSNDIEKLIEDSLAEFKRGYNEERKRLQSLSANKGTKDNDVSNKEIEKSFECKEKVIIEDSFEENKENVHDNSLGLTSPQIENDCLDVLDKLYGDQWRKNKDQVLPKSEPRPRKPKAKSIEPPKTDFKPRILPPFQNPYSEKKRSKNLVNILESARRKAAIESPWVSKLKGLCDSESDEDFPPKTHGLRSIKLQFEEETPQGVFKKKEEGNGLSRTKLQFAVEKKDDDIDGGINKTGKNMKVNGDNRKKMHSDVNTGSRNLKTDYRTKKISVSSNDYDSSSDFGDIGLSLADKLKGKSVSKKTKSPTNLGLEKGIPEYRGRTLSSSSDSSDILTNKDKAKVQNIDKKTKKTRTKQRNSSSDTDEKISEFQNILERININTKDTAKPIKQKFINAKPLSFLASLSDNVPAHLCDASAKIFKNCYKKYRQELVEKLFKIFNENIFDNSIPANMTIEWSDRMRGTAGYCACRKLTRRTGIVEREARLVLSTKVLDSADRLRDTLVHEMCHAATWIINQVSDGHGKYWKAWAAKAMETYPELPEIKRCHDYSISTKYTYRCTDCGYSFGRHSKSIDLNRKRCGYCYGTLEVLLNKVTKDGEKKSVLATPKKEPTGFALFVKQNYAQYKNPNLKHGEVMKILGKKFQDIKIDNS